MCARANDVARVLQAFCSPTPRACQLGEMATAAVLEFHSLELGPDALSRNQVEDRVGNVRQALQMQLFDHSRW